MRIYTKLVGDLFHLGHVCFLKAAKTLGTHLTVCVVPDERVAKLKRAPILTTSERIEVVAACKYVDHVIEDGPKEISLDFMRAYGFDLYVFGAKDEQEYAQKLLDCQQLPAHMIQRPSYTSGISTTEILNRILERFRKV
jgi:cytidyltransferase-like protein